MSLKYLHNDYTSNLDGRPPTAVRYVSHTARDLDLKKNVKISRQTCVRHWRHLDFFDGLLTALNFLTSMSQSS